MIIWKKGGYVGVVRYFFSLKFRDPKKQQTKKIGPERRGFE